MSNTRLFDGVEECKNAEKEYRCNYCAKISTGASIKANADIFTKLDRMHDSKCATEVPNTTCPYCGHPAAFSKAWLCEDGSMMICADPTIEVPVRDFEGCLVPNYNSSSWPKHIENGMNYVLVIHPRDCVPYIGRRSPKKKGKSLIAT